jgi:hypothetical protein
MSTETKIFYDQNQQKFHTPNFYLFGGDEQTTKDLKNTIQYISEEYTSRHYYNTVTLRVLSFSIFAIFSLTFLIPYWTTILILISNNSLQIDFILFFISVAVCTPLNIIMNWLLPYFISKRNMDQLEREVENISRMKYESMGIKMSLNTDMAPFRRYFWIWLVRKPHIVLDLMVQTTPMDQMSVNYSSSILYPNNLESL